MNFQICLCGTQPGYPHATTCPRPLYVYTSEEEARWNNDREALDTQKEAS